MLLLTVGIDDPLHIGDDIRVVIMQHLGGNNYRVGIEAPKDVTILRDKVKKRDLETSEQEQEQ